MVPFPFFGRPARANEADGRKRADLTSTTSLTGSHTATSTDKTSSLSTGLPTPHTSSSLFRSSILSSPSPRSSALVGGGPRSDRSPSASFHPSPPSAVTRSNFSFTSTGTDFGLDALPTSLSESKLASSSSSSDQFTSSESTIPHTSASLFKTDRLSSASASPSKPVPSTTLRPSSRPTNGPSSGKGTMSQTTDRRSLTSSPVHSVSPSSNPTHAVSHISSPSGINREPQPSLAKFKSANSQSITSTPATQSIPASFTATSPSSTAPSNISSAEERASTPSGAIAGGVVGGLAILLVCALLVISVIRRRRSQSHHGSNSSRQAGGIGGGSSVVSWARLFSRSPTSRSSGRSYQDENESVRSRGLYASPQPQMRTRDDMRFSMVSPISADPSDLSGSSPTSGIGPSSPFADPDPFRPPPVGFPRSSVSAEGRVSVEGYGNRHGEGSRHGRGSTSIDSSVHVTAPASSVAAGRTTVTPRPSGGADPFKTPPASILSVSIYSDDEDQVEISRGAGGQHSRQPDSSDTFLPRPSGERSSRAISTVGYAV